MMAVNLQEGNKQLTKQLSKCLGEITALKAEVALLRGQGEPVAYLDLFIEEFSITPAKLDSLRYLHGSSEVLHLFTHPPAQNSPLDKSQIRRLAIQMGIISVQNSNAQELVKAAEAVIDRWETPNYKNAEATAPIIYRLREALANYQSSIEKKI